MDETEETAAGAEQDTEERIDGSEGEEGSDGMSAETPDGCFAEVGEEQPNGGAPEFNEPHGDDGNAVGAAESAEEPPAKETPKQRRARVLAGVPAPAKAKRERKAKAKPKREAKPKGEKVAKRTKSDGPSLAKQAIHYFLGCPEPVSITEVEKALFSAIPKAVALKGYWTDTLGRINWTLRKQGKKEVSEPPDNATPESKRIEFGRRGVLNRTLSGLRIKGVLLRVKGKGREAMWKLSASARKVAEVKGE